MQKKGGPTPTTVTITINIATGNKHEGNSEVKVNLYEHQLENLLFASQQPDLTTLVAEALKDYDERNSK